MPETTLREQTIAGSDNVSITVAVSDGELFFRYRPPAPSENALNIYLALGTHRQIGAAVLPFSQHFEGSTVFLPFKSDLLLSAEVRAGQIVRFLRRWERWRWSEREQTQAFEVTRENGEFVFRIPRPLAGEATKLTSPSTRKIRTRITAGVGFGDAPIAASRVAWATNTFRISTSSIWIQGAACPAVAMRRRVLLHAAQPASVGQSEDSHLPTVR